MQAEVAERTAAENELKRVQGQLIETSRQAGMAEVATGVLHNVGNVLNSVNVSATLVSDSLKKSQGVGLGKAVALMREHELDLGTFITNDPQGKQLPLYFGQMAEYLAAERQSMLKEMGVLRTNIEHIKDIVAMQQSYAKVSGVTEIVNIADLVEDSLRMNVGALERHDVEIVREFQAVPPLAIDKHKVVQILVNLIRNAKYACEESGRPDKRLTIGVTNAGRRFPPENLTRIFNHGFTTRKSGHGFGLHSGAIAAKEIGGFLKAESDGVDRGATFTLELPVQPNTPL